MASRGGNWVRIPPRAERAQRGGSFLTFLLVCWLPGRPLSEASTDRFQAWKIGLIRCQVSGKFLPSCRPPPSCSPKRPHSLLPPPIGASRVLLVLGLRNCLPSSLAGGVGWGWSLIRLPAPWQSSRQPFPDPPFPTNHSAASLHLPVESAGPGRCHQGLLGSFCFSRWVGLCCLVGGRLLLAEKSERARETL